MLAKHQKRQKKHCKEEESDDCDLERTITVPAGQCDISGACIKKQLCCDVDQKDAHHKACAIKKEGGVKHLKFRAQSPCVKQGRIDLEIGLNKKNLRPGTAYVKGPDVKIGGKKYVIDIHQEKGKHYKPDVNVKCKDGKIVMGAPKIQYEKGCVDVEADQLCVRYFDCNGKLVKKENKRLN